MSEYVSPGIVAVAISVILAAALFVPYVILTARRLGEIRLGNIALAGVALTYGLGLAAYVLLPAPVVTSNFCAEHAASAEPQLDLTRMLVDLRAEQAGTGLRAFASNQVAQQIGLNVALFVPCGMLFRHLARWSIPRTTLVSAAMSLLVELTQLTGLWGLYPCPYRLFDVADLLTNTLGGLLGAMLARLLMLIPGQRSTGPVGMPRPVTITRRLLGIAVDLCGVWASGVFLVVTTRATVLVVTGRELSPAWDETVRIGFGFWLPLVALLLVTPQFGAGGTFGQRVLFLRPVDRRGWPAKRSIRLLRTLCGSAGLLVLIGAGGVFDRLGTVLTLVSLLAVATTRTYRGLAGVLSGTLLADSRRADPTEEGDPRSTAPDPSSVTEPDLPTAGRI